MSKIRSYKSPHVEIRYEIPDEGPIVLNSIRTETRFKNKGFATKALTDFLVYTDSLQRDVSLLASPLTANTSLRRLVSWYESFGFKRTGRHNFAFEPYMERPHK